MHIIYKIYINTAQWLWNFLIDLSTHLCGTNNLFTKNDLNFTKKPITFIFVKLYTFNIEWDIIFVSYILQNDRYGETPKHFFFEIFGSFLLMWTGLFVYENWTFCLWELDFLFMRTGLFVCTWFPHQRNEPIATTNPIKKKKKKNKMKKKTKR